ncbi:UDP-glucose 4-epimerase GalE [Patescibacteria group bacterium]|nr:UDP-glucose 4-epimerase GalE [Patescibacteria group bacterium]
MNILVTGGAGYIGSVTVSQLLEAGYKVVVYDSFIKGHKKAVHKDAVFVKGDISDYMLVLKTLRKYKIDAVLHFAAFIEAGESMKVPEKYFHNNTINTLLFLEAMLAVGVRKFIFSSTAAVYGDPKRTPIAEDTDLRPTNAYGASKLLVENTLSWYHKIYGLSYVSLRYFNACGATKDLGEDHSPETHLIPRALQSVMGKGAKLQLFGFDYPTKDGTCIRDYIHVSDLARAHLLALKLITKNGQWQKIYNLGSQNGFSNKEVIEAVGRVVGKSVPYVPTSRRIGDPAVLVASSEKIRKELGWKAKYTNLDEIIESAYRWKLSHQLGYQS